MSLPRDTEQEPHADALLASVLRATNGAAAEGCPDAEVIGLFAEGALAGAELGTVEAHVHVCPRCQAMVAAFVRAQPDEPPVRNMTTAAVDGGGFAAWFSGWRWLVPATSLAAVALVAVWVGRGPADQVAESARGPAEGAMDAAAPAGELDEPRASEAFVPQAGAGGTVADRTMPRPAAPVTPATPQVTGVERREAVPRSAEVASAAKAAGAGSTMAGAGAKSEAIADARSRAADLAANRAVATEAAREASAAPDTARQETLGVTPAPTPPPPAAVAPSATPAFRASLAFSPWRVSEGMVERSRDSGRTWQRVTTPAGARIIEVASPGGDICWALADDGVLRTTDGATWTRTARPTAERLARITASSAGEASVFTAAGARFVTTDGGATWTPAP